MHVGYESSCQQNKLGMLFALSHSKRCDRNERLDGLPFTERLLSGIQTHGHGQVVQRTYLAVMSTYEGVRNESLGCILINKLVVSYCMQLSVNTRVNFSSWTSK